MQVTAKGRIVCSDPEQRWAPYLRLNFHRWEPLQERDHLSATALPRSCSLVHINVIFGSFNLPGEQGCRWHRVVNHAPVKMDWCHNGLPWEFSQTVGPGKLQESTQRGLLWGTVACVLKSHTQKYTETCTCIDIVVHTQTTTKRIVKMKKNPSLQKYVNLNTFNNFFLSLRSVHFH